MGHGRAYFASCRLARNGLERCAVYTNGYLLAPGFQISLFAENLPNARSMTSGEGGMLFVGTRKAGRVYALLDRGKDFKAGQTIVLAEGLRMPNGVASKNGHLYVAEMHRVIRFENIIDNLAPGAPYLVVNDNLPANRHHGWKFIRFGPDGKLYVPVGAPCNVCREQDHRFATIMRMNADGSGLEVFTEGVRNSVGFDYHPQILEDGSLLVADDDAGRIYRLTYHT